ncbi:MAG: Ig-like domain-containing protein, partial [Opitutaceae bacterium]
MASLTMTRGPLSRIVLLFAGLSCLSPAVRLAGAEANPTTVGTRGAEPAVIIGAEPTRLETEGAGVHGQLAVAPEVVSADTRSDLVYAITAEPLHGRVGLAGAEEGADVFKTKTSRLGYFAYRPEEGFTGEDSFTYTVRNETSG